MDGRHIAPARAREHAAAMTYSSHIADLSRQSHAARAALPPRVPPPRRRPDPAWAHAGR
jgi:hypothetical protein